VRQAGKCVGVDPLIVEYERQKGRILEMDRAAAIQGGARVAF
jgi:hypothetical protein